MAKKTKTNKEIFVLSMGEKCQICEYKKCLRCLNFHHIDPKEKDFQISAKTKALKTSLTEIIDELRKCVLLCNRCHIEVHDGVTELPKKYSKLDVKILRKLIEENETEYKRKTKNCPVCGKTMFVNQGNTCSVECYTSTKNKSRKKKRKKDKCWCGKDKFVGSKFCCHRCGNDHKRGFSWDDYDLIALHKVFTKKKLAEIFEVKYSALRAAFDRQEIEKINQ